MSHVTGRVREIARLAGLACEESHGLIGFGVELGGGRSQLVFVADLEEETPEGLHVIAFFSPCQKLGDGFLRGLSRGQAFDLLRRNGQLPFVSFCVLSLNGEDHLCVKSTQILETMELEEFRSHLSWVAEVADAREAELGQDLF